MSYVDVTVRVTDGGIECDDDPVTYYFDVHDGLRWSLLSAEWKFVALENTPFGKFEKPSDRTWVGVDNSQQVKDYKYNVRVQNTITGENKLEDPVIKNRRSY